MDQVRRPSRARVLSTCFWVAPSLATTMTPLSVASATCLPSGAQARAVIFGASEMSLGVETFPPLIFTIFAPSAIAYASDCPSVDQVTTPVCQFSTGVRPRPGDQMASCPAVVTAAILPEGDHEIAVTASLADVTGVRPGVVATISERS